MGSPSFCFMEVWGAGRTSSRWLGKGNDAYPNDTIHSIAAPLLVVHGDDDILVSREHAFELAERVEGARLLNLPFASHSVLEESPMDVLPPLTAFIDGIQEKTKPTG